MILFVENIFVFSSKGKINVFCCGVWGKIWDNLVLCIVVSVKNFGLGSFFQWYLILLLDKFYVLFWGGMFFSYV